MGTNTAHLFFCSIKSSQWNILLSKSSEKAHFIPVKKENGAVMLFLALRRKLIFSAFFFFLAVLVTSLTNTLTIAYIVEAYHKIHSTCVTSFPAAPTQGVEVQGKTGTFQWIFVHNLLSNSFPTTQCWSWSKITLEVFCSTWCLYYHKVWGKSHPIFFHNSFDSLNNFTWMKDSCENSWKVDVNSKNIWVCSDVDYCCRPISTHILINFSNRYREKGNICLNNIAKRKNRHSSHENFTSLHLNADAKFTHMVYIKNRRHFPQS